MSSNKDKVLIYFASGILKHFQNATISGEYILKPNGIQIIIKVYNKNISTTIPYNAIANAVTNIEALQRMRFEIIQELTIAIGKVSKNVNNKPMALKKKHRRRKCSRKYRE